MYRAFVERLERRRDQIPKLGRRLRWQLRALRSPLEGRSKAYRVSGRIVGCLYHSLANPFSQAKVEALAKELDEGEGH